MPTVLTSGAVSSWVNRWPHQGRYANALDVYTVTEPRQDEQKATHYTTLVNEHDIQILCDNFNQLTNALRDVVPLHPKELEQFAKLATEARQKIEKLFDVLATAKQRYEDE